MKCSPTHSRPVSLIEVLLAIALVALCLVPLISMHSSLFRSEYEQASELELDREVGRMQYTIVRGLYDGTYSLDQVINSRPQKVEHPLLTALRFDGYWWFEIEKRKPRDDTAKVFLIQIRHSFGPPAPTPLLFLENQEGDERLDYHFPITLERKEDV